MIRGVLEHYGASTPAHNGKLLCPFHPDHHASALINYETDWFTCLACGVTGNSVKLLMDREGLQYGDALKLATELAGEEYSKVRVESVRGLALPGKSRNRRKDGRAF